MQQLKCGSFYGAIKSAQQRNGVTLTTTSCNIANTEWHYHETPCFTFIVSGSISETNKKESYRCHTGSLVYNNWQEPHRNSILQSETSALHVEIDKNWFDNFELTMKNYEGSFFIKNPTIKILFHHIIIETKLKDAESAIAIDELLLKAFDEMNLCNHSKSNKIFPAWVKVINERLHETSAEPVSLNTLAALINIHPVHLSRCFPKYFNCSLGEYTRKIKVEKSLALLQNKNLSLTEIAYLCGFADQSHFIRCFKAINKIRPLEYRRMIVA
jgi:AraC family transcriptional regulator